MRLEMSLSPGKYRRRYSKDLSEQWDGTPSCWYITEFMFTPRFLFSAGMNLVRISAMLVSTVTQLPLSFSKKYGPMISFRPTAHHTVTFS